MAASAARAEATDKPITVTWKGKTFRLVPSSEWDLDVLESFEDGKVTKILQGVLADDGYATLRTLKPKIADLTDLFEKVSKALGISGN